MLETPFARRLRDLVEASGFTTAEIAEAVGLTRWALHKLLTGQSRPKWDTVCKLAEMFRTSTDTFREEDG